MKSILFVSDAATVHTRRWAEYFRDEGVDVHVASFRDAQIPGVQVHRLPTGGLGRVGYLLAVPVLISLARRIRPDVVHAQYVTSYGFISALARLRPRVVTAWGTDVLISPQQSVLSRFLAGHAVRSADAVTTVAEHMNAAVEALGVAPERVEAVPFGVDANRFRPATKPPPAPPPLRLICTRNFGPVYAIDNLVEAIATVRRSGVALQVSLVGAGPLRGELEAQVARLGLGEVVRFHGQVDHSQLATMLADHHVFVTPARSDGNNVSLNEAMACGCFPIATDIPANAQWLRDGVNGLLYPAGDAARLAACIERAADDGELRGRAAQINRRVVEERADWGVCVARMKATYVTAIERHAARNG
jgi:glycosyltransferase involved in cell wall biosynthesis